MKQHSTERSRSVNMGNLWRLAVVAAVLAGDAQAQTWTGSQINVSMCTWGQLRVNTIRDRVYLDGGNLWWMRGYEDGPGSIDNAYNVDGLLYYLNLSSSFDTATTNLTSLFGSMQKAGGAANNIAPTYQDGVMFANDNMFYLYGGLTEPTAAHDDPPADTVLAYELYQYGADSNLWRPGFLSTDLDNITRYVTNGAGVSSPSENLGFYISGMRAPNWGPIWGNNSATNLSQHMIQVDMADMNNPVWSNLTIPNYVPARANAEAIWVPVSESGAVVLIGGVINPESFFYDGLSDNQTAESERVSPGFMQTISVYDIAGETWYIQNTTGDIPPQLTQFCSVYASASDGSSHNIYIYGGYDGIDPTNYPSDDVYVLSLPSFEWIQLYTGNNTAHGRKQHKCVKPYPDQMLVLGGQALSDADCLDMINVFNLNTGRFQETYNPAEWNDYEVPDLVWGRIGGDASGGATQTSPGSWTNTSLADVFSASYTQPIATWYPYNSTENNITTTTVPTSGGGSGFPAWAGALIGVIVALLLIAGLIAWWFIRRRRNKDARRNSEVSRGARVRNWVGQSGAFAAPGPKDPDNSTVVSGGFTTESTVAPSVTTGVSRPTAEAGSEPVYEMPGQSSGHAIELPTPYNEGGLIQDLSPTSTIPPAGYSSPVSPEIPQENDGGGHSRLTHTRNVSSLSSVPSNFRVLDVLDEDDGRITRPRYVSGVSEASVSSTGTRLGETGVANRGLGLDDIPDTEGDR
ncbi:hypothetical protein BDW59DRAFT_148895 [Aspergillus cavernicola]|uniref:Kelch repeat protein n=1 Tax=Aspergillus cavernicola TaxID=176166 RepID=A0ABR4I6H6_9EURO